MNILRKLIWEIEWKIADIVRYFEIKKCTRLYPDFEDNEYNCGSLKHIWGVTSWDDLSGKDACIYTMNDIDITYDRKTKKYMLGIETAYMFKDKSAECNYLRGLLDAFTKFMDDNNYLKNKEFFLFFNNPILQTTADSIEELYTNFRIFVEGYCKVYK